MAVTTLRDWFDKLKGFTTATCKSLMTGKYGTWFERNFATSQEMYDAMNGDKHSLEYSKIVGDKTNTSPVAGPAQKLQAEWLYAFERDLRIRKMCRIDFYRAYICNKVILSATLTDNKDRLDQIEKCFTNLI